jgi:hypothetical protein
MGIDYVELGQPVTLSTDLVAYWPLDEIDGGTTPDVIGGHDMDLTNISADNVVAGKAGNAISFSNADKTMLSRVHDADEDLPANKHDSFTVSFWSKVQGNGQNDLRLFSESNTTGDGNPLFNIGTKNDGSNGSIDLYIRQSGWPTVGHIFSTAEPFDGEWHHVVFVQDNLERSIYVDGVLDDLVIAPQPEGEWKLTATTIGGILRTDPSHWVSGVIDEVAIWKRALSADETAQLHSDGLAPADAPTISLVRNGDGTLTVTYTGTLQAAATVDGPWEDVEGATSPLTIDADAPATFARTRK